MKKLIKLIYEKVFENKLSKSEALSLISGLKASNTTILHPLIHENTSSFFEKKFSSTFSGREFFFRIDANLKKSVLSPVTYLEMVYAAATKAMAGEKFSAQFKKIEWQYPAIVHEESITVHIRFFKDPNTWLDTSEEKFLCYQIYTISNNQETSDIVHNRGVIDYDHKNSELSPLDIFSLQKHISEYFLDPKEDSDFFEKSDKSNEPYYQSIELLHINFQKEALIKLSFDHVSDTYNHQESLVLHPDILELALQSCSFLCLDMADTESEFFGELQPVSVDALSIMSRCQDSMWVWLRLNSFHEGRLIVDIDLCDEYGYVCVQLKGLVLEANEHCKQNNIIPPTETSLDNIEPYEVMCFEEEWKAQLLKENTLNTQKNTSHTVICLLSEPDNQAALKSAMHSISPQTQLVFMSQSDTQKNSSECFFVNPYDGITYQEALKNIIQVHGVSEIYNVLYLWAWEDSHWIESSIPVVHLLQSIKASEIKVQRILLAANYKTDLQRCYIESWLGFERSLDLVLPSIHLKVFLLQDISNTKKSIAEQINDYTKTLWSELKTTTPGSVLYKKDQRYQLSIQSVTLKDADSKSILRGTVLITGGCGGLGLLFAQYLAKTQGTDFILVGRSPLNEEKQQAIQTLENLGSRVYYLQADVCDKTALQHGLVLAKEHCRNALCAVIHAAGIIDNDDIVTKNIDNFQKVLLPKIEGIRILDEVLADEVLDIVCYFSSASAILGDSGQCDYAVANRFLMSYGNYRNTLVSEGKRSGKTIVFNWPGWHVDSMLAGDWDADNSQQQLDFYLKSSGQRLLEAAEGCELFEKIIDQSKKQFLVIPGQQSRVKRFLSRIGKYGDIHSNTKNIPGVLDLLEGVDKCSSWRPEMKGFTIFQCIEWDLKSLIVQQLKLPIHKVETESNLADFGFDSISLTAYASTLSNHYNIDVTPSIFFTYPTIARLCDYFENDYKAIMENFYRQESIVNNTKKTATTPIQSSQAKSQRAIQPDFLFKQKEDSINKESINNEPIAIIGMSGRFPEARNIHEMWNILSEQRHVVQEISIERFPEYQEYLTQVNGGHWWSGCIPGAYEFDPLFFEISPLEAETMDPRQRLLLQESWNALEDAGYGDCQLKKYKTGMFVGVEEGDYSLLAKMSNVTSIHTGILAARLAYFLNFNGPTMAINTACSSGLVALHQACVSLRQRECGTAIAAGVSIHCTLGPQVGMEQAGILSPDGKCFTFDKRANGMVPGEAVVAVVLKPLSQAIADGDPVYASIRGSGLNYDGKTNGITAPSGTAQTALLKQVYEQAQVDVKHIDYIVAHGTGTQLGDPIEVNALYDAFKDNTDKQNYCALTSTKTNFGHTFAASGLVSLVSLVQALEHEQIPASLHCEEENDYIHWSSSPFYVNKQTRPWPKQGNKARMGALSAFGISGTNTHVIVEDSIREAEGGADPLPYYLIVLSAKTESALQARIHRLQDALQEDRLAKVDMSALAYTLQTGRHHFQYRSALVVQDREDAIYSLGQLRDKVQRLNGLTGHAPRGFKGQIVMVRYIDLLLDKSSTVQEVASDYQEVLLGLADYYCQGYEIDWWRLYEGRHPPRLHLPTYPFAREEYRPTPRVEKPGVTASIPLSSEAVSETSVTPDAEIVLSYPHWQPQTLAGAKEGAIACDRWVLWYGLDIADEWLAEIKGLEFIRLSSASSGVEKRYGDIALAVFEWLKHLLQESPNSQILIQVLIPNEEEYRVYAGISGLLKTAHLENPAVKGQVIEVEPGLHRQALQAMIEENAMTPDIRRIRYESGDRWVQQWAVEGHEPCGQEVLWQPGGVYLISGGVGGIGLHIAHAMAVDVSDVVFILTGRSRLKDLTVAQREKLTELASLCARLEYHSVDVGSRDELKHLLDTIVTSYGQLDGIVHSAGITRDNFILKKSVEEFDSVLHPKVSGAVYLDELTRDMDIDFFILFSSISSVLGNVGQSDYAVANSFMDEFALYRHRLVERQARRGRTVSINWPYWKEGGMRLEASTEALMQQNDVMVALETQQGVEALRRALQTGHGQLMVTMGEPVWMKEPRRPTLPESTAVEMDSRPLSELDDKCLRQKVQRQFKGLLAEVIKLPLERMDTQAPLERYGIDSLIVIQVNQALAAIFDALPKTLLFEYQTIDAVVAYLVEQHRQACRVWTGLTATGQAQREGVISSTSSAGVEPVTPRQKEGHPIQKDIKCREHPVTDEPIAIIGLSGHYPQANSLDAYWENLKAGKDCIREIPDDRWSLDGFFHEDVEEAIAQGKSYSKWGGFLEGFADFDPLFFNLSPREVMTIDPQERLFLQSAWEAVEDAGYTRAQLASQFNKRVGVFAGITKTGFNLYAGDLNSQAELFYPYTSFSMLVNRVSYFLDLQGPSIPVDTMCSSSLTAIHEACEHLHRQRCELAIAGGVNLYLHPSSYIHLCAGHILSKNNRCSAFGQGGDGFVPGEGVGCVLLKPLSCAERDGDNIYAVILGSHTNHSGRAGGMGPNLNAQSDLIIENLRQCGIAPDTIGYVESASNGSHLGDSIELRALDKAFSQHTKKRDFCAIGSVKPNIGHLESASGMSQLTKVLLQLRHKQLVPSIHAQPLNSNIDFEDTAFRLQKEVEEWKRLIVQVNGENKEIPRRAAINSFGAGGVNANLIIQEYEDNINRKPEEVYGPFIIVLSALNENQLKLVAHNLYTYLNNYEQLDTEYMANIAYTLQIGREEMPCRVAMVVDSYQGLIQYLRVYLKLDNNVDKKMFIPEIFYGDLTTKNYEMNSLISGEIGDIIFQKLFTDGDLEKIALYWTQGGEVPWNLIHEGKNRKRISLPTYPFEKRWYWISEQYGDVACQEDKVNINVNSEKSISQNEITQQSIQKILIDFLVDITNFSRQDINPGRMPGDYGVDSLLGMRFLNRINSTFNIEADALLLTEGTINSISHKVHSFIVDKKNYPMLPNFGLENDSNKENKGWVKPSFIEFIKFEINPEYIESSTKNKDYAILENLINNGVGVWRENNHLCFEFFYETHTNETIKKIVFSPEILFNSLDKGKRYFPSSCQQKNSLYQTEVEKFPYNLIQGFRVEMPVNIEILNKAFNHLVNTYSIFRTKAMLINKQWIQVIHDGLSVRCEEIIYEGLSAEKDFTQQLIVFQKEQGKKLFDIDNLPLLKIYFIHNGKDLAAIFVHAHHFCADGFTFFSFQKEFHDTYESIMNGGKQSFDKVMAEYGHFALCEYNPKNKELTKNWLDKIRDKNFSLKFKDKKDYVGQLSSGEKIIELEVSVNMLEKLRLFNDANNTTLTQLLCCAVAILLYRLSRLPVPLQMVNSRRDKIEFEIMMGDFASTLPMILELQKHFSIRDVLFSYEKEMLDIQRYKWLDISELRKNISKNGRNPYDFNLFGNILIDSNDMNSLFKETNCSKEMVPVSMEINNILTDMAIFLMKKDDYSSLMFIYDAELFSSKTMRLFSENIRIIIDIILKNTDKPIEEIEILIELKNRLYFEKNLVRL
uniref:BryD n=1 Tax=Candidatus Endobugula sertula TaxID=62101 RepID=A2CLL4_9GAMM|nr:BryD [Candidatus Endobugula sertula]